MLALILVLAASSPERVCADPDEFIPANRRALLGGEPCKRYVEKTRDGPAAAQGRSKVPVSKARQQAVRTYFGAALVDAPSARWRWPNQERDRDFYCVWINAKNRMGGYTGWEIHAVQFRDGKPGALTITLENMGNGDRSKCDELGYDTSGPTR